MDLTKGCQIEFTEAVFTGFYPRSKYSHDRTIKGVIVKDSYGLKTNQHTFTILVEKDSDGILQDSKICRKGRNVYPTCRVLKYPENHKELAEEKHKRKRDKGEIRN